MYIFVVFLGFFFSYDVVIKNSLLWIIKMGEDGNSLRMDSDHAIFFFGSAINFSKSFKIIKKNMITYCNDYATDSEAAPQLERKRMRPPRRGLDLDLSNFS